MTSGTPIMIAQMAEDRLVFVKKWWKLLCVLLLMAGCLFASVALEYELGGTSLRIQIQSAADILVEDEAVEANGNNAPAAKAEWLAGALIPLDEFCPTETRCKPEAGRKPCHAVFRQGVVLYNVSLVVPEGAVDCNSIPSGWGEDSLRTRYNPGRKSTPKLPTFVLIGAQGLDDLPQQLQCQATVEEPSVFASFIHWGQYGHNTFNGISLLYDMFTDNKTGLKLQPPLADQDRRPPNSTAPSTRLYLWQDEFYRPWDRNLDQTPSQLSVGPHGLVLRMFTAEQVKGLGWLLRDSLGTRTCFRHLVVGLSGELDHYNAAVPREGWMGFAGAVRRHLGVTEPPRERKRGSAPAIAHPLIECRELPASSTPYSHPVAPVVKWKRAGEGRPRLVLLQRKESRRIANGEEVLKVATDLGLFGSVEMVTFEGMEVEDQIRLMGKTDVLMGMDGTGLMNGLFMPVGGVVIHIRPYGCLKYMFSKGSNFQRLWLASPGHAISFESEDSKTGFYPEPNGNKPRVRFPKDLLQLDDLKWVQMTAVLAQDTIIKPGAAKCLVGASFRLLQGKSVDWTEVDKCSDNALARKSSC